jgi:hypothetical protein
MNTLGKHTATAAGVLLMGVATVQAAEYINAAGGDWETAENWDTGLVPTNGAVVTIAGSSIGQSVVLDADSWSYLTNNALNYSATEYRTSTFTLAGSETASLDVDIGAGNTWKATTSGTYYVGSADGSDGILNVLSGNVVLEASIMQIAQSAGSIGQINVMGADASYTAARASGTTSLSVGPAGKGTFYIDAGTFTSRMGVSVGTNGTFEVAGSAVSSIGVGSYSSLNGDWQQASNGVLKVGIDAGGLTPILIDDVSFDGPDGFVSATFEDGALLEPYFVDGVQTGKWTVMTVDGSITDSGLVLDNGGDENWSLNVVSNYILEVWYGLGDSGYEPEPPPDIVYTNGTCIWDGEAGDADWDNPTNWAFDVNNVLPDPSGTSGATLQFDTTENYPEYTFAYGSRSYNRIHVGYGADGRFDVLGSGYTLSASAAGSHYIGTGGNTGTLNVDGGATISYGASLVYVGNTSSTGIVNLANSGRMICGRESSGISCRIGYGTGGNGTVNVVDNGRFYTRAGVAIGLGGTGLFSVQGSGATILIGSEGTLDGTWAQYDGGTLQGLVSSNGLSSIFVDDKDGDGVGGDVNFYEGAVLDVDFTGFDGQNGSWDLMTWEGSLVESNLTFAADVDTNIWSFAFVDAGVSSNGVDTLRITASGFAPTVVPDITAFSVSGTDVSLTWDSEPGYSYSVLSKDALVSSTWTTNVGGIPSAGASTSTNLTTSGTKEFYRIEAY